MGQKALHLKFVGTTRLNPQKRDNPKRNGTYDHPRLMALHNIILVKKLKNSNKRLV